MTRDDTRAVSVALSHALTIGITAILLSGLLVGSATLLETQEERIAVHQADEIGADILTHVDKLERLNESDGTVNATVRLNYPEEISGSRYAISFRTESVQFETNATLQIESPALPRTAAYPIPNDTRVVESGASGQNPQLRLCGDGNITFADC